MYPYLKVNQREKDTLPKKKKKDYLWKKQRKQEGVRGGKKARGGVQCSRSEHFPSAW